MGYDERRRSEDLRKNQVNAPFSFRDKKHDAGGKNMAGDMDLGGELHPSAAAASTAGRPRS